MKIYSLWIVLPTAAASIWASAGSLDVQTHLASDTQEHGSFHISVFDGAASWKGPVGEGTFGDGTVLDYAFYNSSGGRSQVYAGADEGLILAPDFTATNRNSQHQVQLWTETDPKGFTVEGDFGAQPESHTVAVAAGVEGEIDVSSIEAGVVYVIHGSFHDKNWVSASLTGTRVKTLRAKTGRLSRPRGMGYWVTAFAFKNPRGQYDTLTYAYTNADEDGSRARVVGLVVTEEPVGGVEPK